MIMAFHNVAVIYVIMESSGRPVQNPLLYVIAGRPFGRLDSCLTKTPQESPMELKARSPYIDHWPRPGNIKQTEEQV